METIVLELPWPPSVNNYKKMGGFSRSKNGNLYQKRVNTDETKMYFFKVWQRVKAQMPTEGVSFSRSATIRVGVTLELHPPHNRRYDIDNFCKVLFDALTNAKVWLDDSQIDRLFIIKSSQQPDGYVKVTAYPLE